MKVRGSSAVIRIVGFGILLAGCSNIERLGEIGRPPRLAPPSALPAPAYEPSLAAQAAAGRTPAPPSPATPSASLFKSSGGTSLFRDQRAARVGDILTVRIDIADRAQVDNATSRSRDGSASAGIPALGGLQKHLGKNPGRLLDASGGTKTTGTGQTARSERVALTVAAVVSDVLPNGNLIIQGRQQVRVNNELRDLTVGGIVRPEDIAADNTVQHTQIADARIAYGGRGVLTDVQQPGWLQQATDLLSPF